MLTNNFFKFLAVSAILLGTSVFAQGRQIREDVLLPMNQRLNAANAPASAPTVVHDYDWYAAKTYTWTDANGTSHTASIVDEVTNPYQMYDLLKWVYCNPEIPGNKTTAVTGGSVYYGEQYILDKEGWLFPTYPHVDPGWGITNSNVTAPYEDGHTLFLVKLKNYGDVPDSDMYTRSKSDIINYFNKYIESIKLITATLRGGEGENAGTMVNIEGEFNRFFMIGKGKSYYWEPQYYSDNEEHYPPFAPFYNMFEEYSPTSTDEGAQITDFYDKMNDGETYPVVHDCGSVIMFEHYFSMAGKDNDEEKSLTGMIFFIPDNRNASGERNYDINHQPYVGMYVIDLSGKATDKGEHVYNVQLDWTSTLNEVAKSEVPQTYTLYVYVTNETGETREEIITTTETTYNYDVPQDEHSYTITYVVHGEATQNNEFNTWSNDATVIIPGWNDFISLTLDHSESDFVKSELKNYYRNFLGIINDVNAITPENIDAGMNQILVNRFNNEEPDAFTTVATITFTNNNGNVSYAIEYVGQDILSGYNLNTLNIPVSGNLGHYGAGDIVNLAPITIVDQFAESVEGNNHPDGYGYVLKLNDKTSNDVPVEIVKVDATIDGYYTQDEVDADTDLDNLLPVNVKSANFEFTLKNNGRIYYYTIDRGNDVQPNQQISYLQRRQDGTFMEMNNALGNAGNIYEEGVLNFFDEDPYYGTTGHYLSYLPIAWTFGTNRVKHDGENSYGSPIIYTGVGNVELAVRGTKAKNKRFNWADENDVMCTIYNPFLTITGNVAEASVEYMPYMYRVWRMCDNIRNYDVEWNLTEGYYYYVNNAEAPREAQKLIAEVMTSDETLSLGDNNDALAFGATNDATVNFYVRFYYVKADRATNENKYYVVDAIMPWTDIKTNVNELNVNDVVSKTYVNAQGIKSDKPFSGLNIVITRYSDGTTSTSKVVR